MSRSIFFIYKVLGEVVSFINKSTIKDIFTKEKGNPMILKNNKVGGLSLTCGFIFKTNKLKDNEAVYYLVGFQESNKFMAAEVRLSEVNEVDIISVIGSEKEANEIVAELEKFHSLTNN